MSIIPRGIGAFDHNIQRPTADRHLMTEVELANKMAALTGGFAAESLVFDKLSTGTANDLRQATNIARTMATRYGMNETLGKSASTQSSRVLVAIRSVASSSARSYNEQTARELDETAAKLLAKETRPPSRLSIRRRIRVLQERHSPPALP